MCLKFTVSHGTVHTVNKRETIKSLCAENNLFCLRCSPVIATMYKVSKLQIYEQQREREKQSSISPVMQFSLKSECKSYKKQMRTAPSPNFKANNS